MCCVKYLVGNGRIFDIYEIEKSKAVGVVFDGLAEQYKAEIEQEKKMEEIRLYQEKKSKKKKLIIAICFGLVLCFILILSPIAFLIIAGVIGVIYFIFNAPKEPAPNIPVGDFLKVGMGLFMLIAHFMGKNSRRRTWILSTVSRWKKCTTTRHSSSSNACPRCRWPFA